MKNIEEEINRVWDIAVYLQMLAAFSDDLDFNSYNKLMLNFQKSVKQDDRQQIPNKLVVFEEELEKIAMPLRLKYPLKRNYREIAKDWNELLKNDKELFDNGIMIGWLEKQIDLTNFYKYDYAPFQFKLGLVINKGKGDIEENFLLQDSFSSLVKAKKRLKILDNFSTLQKTNFISQGKNEFDKATLDLLNLIKYEISFYSRITIVSFFSFFECLVNSIGFDYYYRNIDNLNSNDSETLQGRKKGVYLNLKEKIEKFQQIIRSDNTPKIILSDKKHVQEPFKSLFENYKDLRNASVHFSPIKEKIWLRPDEWVTRAETFSKLVLEASLELWKSCHQTKKGPDYLGRFEYARLYRMAETKEDKIKEIEKWL